MRRFRHLRFVQKTSRIRLLDHPGWLRPFLRLLRKFPCNPWTSIRRRATPSSSLKQTNIRHISRTLTSRVSTSGHRSPCLSPTRSLLLTRAPLRPPCNWRHEKALNQLQAPNWIRAENISGTSLMLNESDQTWSDKIENEPQSNVE